MFFKAGSVWYFEHFQVSYVFVTSKNLYKQSVSKITLCLATALQQDILGDTL